MGGLSRFSIPVWHVGDETAQLVYHFQLPGKDAVGLSMIYKGFA
jgi:hypothetical protein